MATDEAPSADSATPNTSGEHALPGEDAMTAEWNRVYEARSAGRQEECIERLRSILRTEPENARAHAYLGTVMDDLEEWDAAISEYREAIRINPADMWSRADLAEALVENGEGEAAVLECMEALHLDPNNWKVHNALGLVFYRLDMPTAALFEFHAALQRANTARDQRAVRFEICIALFSKARLSHRRRL